MLDTCQKLAALLACLELAIAERLRKAAAYAATLLGGGAGGAMERRRSLSGARRGRMRRADGRAGLASGSLSQLATETSGQGTTEYAILVGVLVLMAIIAVVAMRDNLQKLWTSIADGINSL